MSQYILDTIKRLKDTLDPTPRPKYRVVSIHLPSGEHPQAVVDAISEAYLKVPVESQEKTTMHIMYSEDYLETELTYYSAETPEEVEQRITTAKKQIEYQEKGLAAAYEAMKKHFTTESA